MPPFTQTLARLRPKSVAAGFARLTSLGTTQLSEVMTNPLDANFNDYKKAENQALKILQEMKTAKSRSCEREARSRSPGVVAAHTPT